MIVAGAVLLIGISRLQRHKRIMEPALCDQFSSAHQTDFTCRRDGQRLISQRRNCAATRAKVEGIGDNPEIASGNGRNHDSCENAARDPRHAGISAAGLPVMCTLLQVRYTAEWRGSDIIARGLQSVEPVQQRKGFFPTRPALDCGCQQLSRDLTISTFQCSRPGADQFFPFALALGDGAARPLDVRARLCMAAIQKQDASPDIDGEFVLTSEVMIQTDEEQLFDSGVTFPIRRVPGGGPIRTKRVGHSGELAETSDMTRGGL
jgi:hypothetical protein